MRLTDAGVSAKEKAIARGLPAPHFWVQLKYGKSIFLAGLRAKLGKKLTGVAGGPF